MSANWELTPEGEARIPPPHIPRLLPAPATLAEREAGRALVVAGSRLDHVLVVTSGGVVAREVEDLADLAARARAFAEGARAASTREAYRKDFAHFDVWCTRHDLAALPAAPGTLVAYLTAHADTLKVATLTRRISAIAVAHRQAGYAFDARHPEIHETWAGIRRARGKAQRQAEALTVPLLKALLATCTGDRLVDLRDRALLLVGFAAALRRSELVALDLADVEESERGLNVRLARSKGDQEGEGTEIAVARTGRDTCPATAYAAWIASAGLTEGRAFRSIDRFGRSGVSLSDRAVALIVQARARAAGLDAPGRFSGHSLRAGFATSAAEQGIEERVIMRQTRHRSVAVARRYIRAGERWSRNLSAEIGL